MRFLKKKIALALSFYQGRAQEKQTSAKISRQTEMKEQDPWIENNQSPPKLRSVSESYRATKNIVKNYGRAIIAFASSNLALPYLEKILEKEDLSMQQFVRYITQIRGSIDGLTHFRSTILIGRDDDKTLAASKRALIAVSKVFIKYFSVNWIYNSRVFHKEAHLQFRFKMLRRIQHPELFTYLKGKTPTFKKL